MKFDFFFFKTDDFSLIFLDFFLFISYIAHLVLFGDFSLHAIFNMASVLIFLKLFQIFSTLAICVIWEVAIFMSFISVTLVKLILILPTQLVLAAINSVAGGRPIGALGLVLSAMGLLFECYQVVELCLNDGCYGINALRS